MQKFKAPEHVTGIFTGGNEYRADKHGVATLPDDAPGADVQAMLASGWTRHDAAHVQAMLAAAPRKRARKSKGGGKPAAPAPAEPAVEPASE